MVPICNGHGEQDVGDNAIAALTPPRLAKIRDIRRELAKVYVGMKRGEIESAVGSRLAFVLMSICKTIEAEQIESRIDALERNLHD